MDQLSGQFDQLVQQYYVRCQQMLGEPLPFDDDADYARILHIISLIDQRRNNRHNANIETPEEEVCHTCMSIGVDAPMNSLVCADYKIVAKVLMEFYDTMWLSNRQRVEQTVLYMIRHMQIYFWTCCNTPLQYTGESSLYGTKVLLFISGHRRGLVKTIIEGLREWAKPAPTQQPQILRREYSHPDDYLFQIRARLA